MQVAMAPILFSIVFAGADCRAGRHASMRDLRHATRMGFRSENKPEWGVSDGVYMYVYILFNQMR